MVRIGGEFQDDIKRITGDLRKFGPEVQKALAEAVETNAREMEMQAVVLAPFDKGKLRQNIQSVQVTKLTWEVVANFYGTAPYSAYHEYGTGDYVDIPPGYEEIAGSYRGRGVRKVNIRPKPYMYPAAVRQEVIFFGDVSDLLEKAIRIFGNRK